MSAQNIVSLGFNVEELTAEKKQVLDLFVDLFGKLQEYDGTKFNPLGNGGLVDLKKSLTDGAAAMTAFGETAQKYNAIVTEQAQKQAAGKKTTDELSSAMAQYQKIIDQLSATQAKNNAAGSDAAAGLAVEKEALSQRNAELRNAAKLQLAEIDSINEAKAANAQLIAERNELNLSDEASIAKKNELNAAIDKNNEFIRANSSELEKQKINIGNYPQIVGILGSSLAGIQEKLEQMAAAGQETTEAFARLTLEQKILQGTMDRQEQGFSNVNQALRSTKNALDAMALAGLENTETFEKLNLAYTAAEQKVKDLHREQSILTSDAPGITALTGVAKGLGGAYALGAGAASLLADGNEKVEKELNKLVAVMTFLQGLQEATSALRERNAIGAALETEATKALNFVKEIEAKIWPKQAAAVAADTEAKIANVAATEASEAATITNTAAVEAEAVATEGAAAATIGLKTALVGTGIGIVIVAIALLIAKIIEWSEADNKAARESAELAEAMEKINSILVEQIRLYDEDADRQKKNFSNAIDFADKNKQSYNDLLNLRKANNALAIQEAENNLKIAASTKDSGDGYKKIKDQTADLTKSLDPLLERRKRLLEIEEIFRANKDNRSQAYYEQYQKFGTNVHDSDAKDQEASVEKQIESVKKLIKEKTDLTDAFDASQHERVVLSLEDIQHEADEERKITLQTALQLADLRKSQNQLILSDDRSTLAQRLAAIQSNADQERKIVAATLNEQLSRPDARDNTGKLTADSTIAIQKAAEDRKKITASNEAEQYKTIVDWNDKRLAFLNDINKNQLDQDAAAQDGISKDTQKNLDERLTALKASIADKTKSIEADYSLQMALAKEHNKTQAEIDKIESDRQKGIAALTADTQKQIYDIAIAYGEQRLKAIQEQNKADGAGVAASDKYNAQEDALDKSLLNQTVSYGKFVGEKKKLDEQYLLDKDRADIADDQAALARLKASEEKEIQIKIDAAKGRLDAAKVGGDVSGVAAAQSELNGLLNAQKEYAADVTTVRKKLAADNKKLDDDSIKNAISALQFRNEKEKELEEASFNLAQGLVDASYEKKVNQIQHETDLQDQASEEQIAAIGRSSLSTRQQAEEDTILTAQQRSRDIAAKKEERAEKVAEAKFDRDVAVAKAIWAGAQAEIAAIGEYGGTPYGFAIAAVIAALTAVQVATILAKPIPAYAEGIGIPGRGRHAGGAALVGEEGPERIKIPGRDPFVVDEPTLINLPADSSVMPLGDGSSLVYGMGGMAISRNADAINRGADGGKQAWDIARWQTARMERAFKRSQSKIINKIVIPSETAGLGRQYYDTKILGKKR